MQLTSSIVLERQFNGQTVDSFMCNDGLVEWLINCAILIIIFL